VGDGLLRGLCILAAVLAVVVMVDVAIQIISNASLSINKLGFGFLTSSAWKPNFNDFGAAPLIVDTLITSAVALALAVPIGIAIALFLAIFCPQPIRVIASPLVEMLAAVPSVIVGLWGIIVLGPFVRTVLEPVLHDTLGFIPLFGPPQSAGSSVFTASLVLTIMIVPIVAALGRDLFLAVPKDMQDGATALGSTRWEVIRGVVLPSVAPGLAAASFLALGRALGEAIAVTQVIGAGGVIHASLFQTGDTLASRIAEQFPGETPLHLSALFYLAVILLVIALIANISAQVISRRFERSLGTRG
jgi:phosphate transport system permease protein